MGLLALGASFTFLVTVVVITICVIVFNSSANKWYHDTFDDIFNGNSDSSQGITGATGGQGITGATGSQGLIGSKGITGATGSQGIIGSKGITGATGSQRITGSQGITGSQSITGATGSQGMTGSSQGITGATGSQGVGVELNQPVFDQNDAGLPVVDFVRFGGTTAPVDQPWPKVLDTNPDNCTRIELLQSAKPASKMRLQKYSDMISDFCLTDINYKASGCPAYTNPNNKAKSDYYCKPQADCENLIKTFNNAGNFEPYLTNPKSITTNLPSLNAYCDAGVALTSNELCPMNYEFVEPIDRPVYNKLCCDDTGNVANCRNRSKCTENAGIFANYDLKFKDYDVTFLTRSEDEKNKLNQFCSVGNTILKNCPYKIIDPALSEPFKKLCCAGNPVNTISCSIGASCTLQVSDWLTKEYTMQPYLGNPGEITDSNLLKVDDFCNLSDSIIQNKCSNSPDIANSTAYKTLCVGRKCLKLQLDYHKQKELYSATMWDTGVANSPDTYIPFCQAGISLINDPTCILPNNDAENPSKNDNFIRYCCDSKPNVSDCKISPGGLNCWKGIAAFVETDRVLKDPTNVGNAYDPESLARMTNYCDTGMALQAGNCNSFNSNVNFSKYCCTDPNDKATCGSTDCAFSRNAYRKICIEANTYLERFQTNQYSKARFCAAAQDYAKICKRLPAQETEYPFNVYNQLGC